MAAMAAADEGEVQSEGLKPAAWEAAKNTANKVGEAVKYLFSIRPCLVNPKYCD